MIAGLPKIEKNKLNNSRFVVHKNDRSVFLFKKTCPACARGQVKEGEYGKN
ncbi:hypothetical protein KAU39_02440 [bacterium]|nr:hypothetical protein [bacterium]